MTLLHQARCLLRRVGLEAHRANAMTIWEMRLPCLLALHGVRTVLDVGANDGGFASALFQHHHGDVVSFEPLPEAWERLSQRAAKKPNWHVAPRMALSDANGDAIFHKAGNSVSSSLLPMTAIHNDAAPASALVSSIRVETRRLDDVLPELGRPGPYYLKLDVQGAERLAIAGAQRALRESIIGIQLEMSVATLYEGQSSAAELDAFLRNMGFEIWDLLPGFRNPDNLRMLQYDGIYFRTAS